MTDTNSKAETRNEELETLTFSVTRSNIEETNAKITRQLKRSHDPAYHHNMLHKVGTPTSKGINLEVQNSFGTPQEATTQRDNNTSYENTPDSNDDYEILPDLTDNDSDDQMFTENVFEERYHGIYYQIQAHPYTENRRPKTNNTNTHNPECSTKYRTN